MRCLIIQILLYIATYIHVTITRLCVGLNHYTVDLYESFLTYHILVISPSSLAIITNDNWVGSIT